MNDRNLAILEQAMRKTLSFAFQRGWDAYAGLSKRPGFTGRFGDSDWRMYEVEVADELEANLKMARAALSPRSKPKRAERNDALNG